MEGGIFKDTEIYSASYDTTHPKGTFNIEWLVLVNSEYTYPKVGAF